MKNFLKFFSLALLQTLFVLSLPFLTARPAASSAPIPEEIAAPPTASAPPEGDGVPLWVLQGEERQQMTMADYLFGVVAAEMPARFAPEALRAQAVAARTFALYRAGQGKHDGAVCTDPACCQARLEESALRERWGADYEANAAKLRAAVSATDGLILTWEGAPILAAFHACSGGMTETGRNVFGLDLPYLQSVPGMEDPAAVPAYETVVDLGPEELAAALADWEGEAALTASEGPLLTEPVWSPAGRLLRVRLGGVELTGQKLRQLFGLRSTVLRWQQREDGGLIFTVTGYGHGAGMSQYGAEAMAEAGEGFEAILAHFYPGAVLDKR